MIISFVKLGECEEVRKTNNVFFCFIICAIYLLAQIKSQPFMNQELNDFSLKSSVILLINIFLGIFSSVSHDLNFSFILFTFLSIFNLLFVILILKKYFVIQLLTKKNLNNQFLKNLIEKSKIILEHGYYIFIFFNILIELT